MTTAVIIPYFQREAGILRRAVGSIADQSNSDWRIVIVDDQSPLPAHAEMATLPIAIRSRTSILEQENSGPGSARNLGLEALQPSDTAAAFLDSDDVWDQGHLERAKNAITDHGAEIYLAAIGGGDGFDYHADMRSILDQWPHTTHQADPPLHAIDGLCEKMLTDWSFMHLSSLVLSPSLAKTVRFEPDLRLAAEDVLFFSDATRLSKRTLVSTAPGAVRGHGDNLFHGVDNTADKFLKQQFCVWSAFHMLKGRTALSPNAEHIVTRRQKKARCQALWGQMARRRAGKPLQLSQLAEWTVKDPGLITAAAALALGRSQNDADLV
ncbi:MAG: glycosyltransferase family 2 protein [Pseudomonadota bacterium]